MTHLFGDAPHIIPAQPLAVTDDGSPDWASQRLLTRYYLAAGVTGLAVGVHTTQFEIHDDDALFARTLREVADVVRGAGSDITLIAGICGDIDQAVAEAKLARDQGYVAGLVSPYGLTDRSEASFLARYRAVAEVLPVIGFYMQEAVGGQYFSPDFWASLLELDQLVAIKVAPFERYRTGDVARAIATSGRDDVVLLTGNDDAIVTDLLLPHRFGDGELRFTGGLLGQWSVGTKAAVDLTRRIWDGHDGAVPQDVLAAATDVTQVNQAVFDPEHKFAGSIAGVNETLRQQGLMTSSRCLADDEVLAEGQAERIARVRELYPELLDEEFIAANIDSWRDA